jgi:lysophospholipase L1-like esterase
MLRALARASKLIAGNLAVMVALLATLNALSWLAVGFRLSLRPPDAVDARSQLPNYADKAQARRMYDEYRPSLRARYEPFVGWTRLPWKGEFTNIDNEGDRIHVAPAHTGPRRTARFFGGSTMWGTGAADAGTIPALFNELHPEYAVHNHGETAFTARQGLTRLITLLTRGETVDLAVFFDGVNDVVQQCRVEVGVPGHERVGWFREAITQYLEKPSLMGALRYAGYDLFLRYTLQIGQALTRRIVEADAETSEPVVGDGYDCDEDRGKAGAVADALVRTWEIAHGIVTSRGGTFVAILQPHAYVGSPRIDHLEGILGPAVGRSLQSVYPLLQERVAAAGHAWVHDLTHAYDRDQTNDAYLLVDGFHVSAQGNRVIVQHIDEILRANSRD